MTTRKSGLLGLMLGVMVLAACEDPPVEQPQISVDIVPDTATLSLTAPGNTRQFTAIVNGSANQAVTWSSSVTAVASVSGSGLVTAVAAGSTQIVATSVADPTQRAAAAVTVGSPPAPTITIAAVNQGGTNVPVTTGNVRGQIDVIADLQRPTGTSVSRVEFLVDGALLDGTAGRPNCTQTFTSGGSADLEVNEAAEQIICSINTAGFVEATGAPAFVNGNHTVSARAVHGGGQVSANSQALTFNNPNFINATVTFVPAAGRPACVNAGGTRSIGGAGSLWCTGDVRVNVIQVNYGAAAQALASATVTLTTDGDGVSWFAGNSTTPACRTTNDANGDPTIAPVDRAGATGGADFPGCAEVTKTASDNNAADGLSVTFSSASGSAGTGASGVFGIEDGISFKVNTVTAGGQAGPVCVNPVQPQNPIGDCGTGNGNFSDANELFSVNPFRLDNLAPRVTLFDLTPTACGSATGPCYVNGGFTFTTRSGFYASVDYGVNNQSTSTIFQAGASATALATAASGATLNNTATANDLLLRVSARDSLGNTALLYPTADRVVVTGDAALALKFGIDKVAPFVSAVTAPANNSANVTPSFVISAADTSTAPAGPSGINQTQSPSGAVIVKVERITATATACLPALGGSTFNCNTGGNQGNGTDAVGNNQLFNFGNPANNAYYRVTYAVRDNAGNISASTSVLLLKDTNNPTAGLLIPPSVITGNGSAAFNAEVQDNLDLGDVAAYVEYVSPATPGPSAPVMYIQDVAAPTSIGTYGPDTFTTGPVNATTTLTNFMRSVQLTLAGAVNRAGSVTFNVRDAAGAAAGDPCPAVDNVGAPTDNCVARRDQVGAAITAGITTANPQTSFADVFGATGVYSTNAPSALTVCNGTPGTGNNQPCPTNPASTTLTASASGPSATFASPFARVNFYYMGTGLTNSTGGRHVLIGTGTQTATQDTGTTRTFNWSLNWTPANLAAGPYTVVAIGVDSKGQGLIGAGVHVVNLQID
jgi:Big-like domain-containing protein